MTKYAITDRGKKFHIVGTDHALRGWVNTLCGVEGKEVNDTPHPENVCVRCAQIAGWEEVIPPPRQYIEEGGVHLHKDYPQLRVTRVGSATGVFIYKSGEGGVDLELDEAKILRGLLDRALEGK